MKAIWNNIVVAESNDTVVIEGNHYFPADSIKKEFFKESLHTSECPWKGHANYFSLDIDGETNQDAAWYYKEPKPEAIERLEFDFSNYVAFWKGVEVTS